CGARVWALVPGGAEALEPAVQLAEGRGGEGIEAAGALRADGGEAAVAEHLQVLRDGRLRDAELCLDDRGDGPRRDLALREQLEDPAADRVTQDVERVHEPECRSIHLYKSTMIWLAALSSGHEPG